jgi:YbbR domain-containing protein
MNVPRLIADNIGLKLVSLVIASLFWLYVIVGREGEIRAKVPVYLVNMSDQVTMVAKPPSTVEVDIRGNRIHLMTLDPGSLRLDLDMRGVEEGTVQFSNLESVLKTGRGVRVTRVYPGRMEVSVAKLRH